MLISVGILRSMFLKNVAHLTEIMLQELHKILKFMKSPLKFQKVT